MIIPFIVDKINDLINKKFDIKSFGDISYSKYIEQICYDKIRTIEECTFTNNDGETDILFYNNVYKLNIKFLDINNNVLVSNLMSIDRIKKLLQDETYHIIYIFIEYKLNDNDITITNVHISNMENIDWNCLTIQNLGKGQLQMKNNSEPIMFNFDITRKDWLDELKKQAIQYYDKMILKITEYKMDWEKNNL